MVALCIENYTFSKKMFFSHVQCMCMGTYIFNAYITMQQVMMLYIFYDNRPNNANIFNVNILNAGNRPTACLCSEKYPSNKCACALVKKN